MRKTGNKLKALRRAGGLFYLLPRRLWARDTDIRQQRVIKQPDILENNRNQAIELFRRQAANIDAANRNLPLLRIGIAH